jgi:transposase
MSSQLVTDELWNEVAPLLPVKGPKPKGGRPPVHDRKCLAGILFVLKSGIPWNDLPAEFGCGSGWTCWRRLALWTMLGIWPELHRRLLNRLGRLDEIDWSRAVVDSASMRAVFGGSTQAQTPLTEPSEAANAIL